MMYAVLSLGLALLGGVIRLAQVLRLAVPLLYGALDVYKRQVAWSGRGSMSPWSRGASAS